MFKKFSRAKIQPSEEENGALGDKSIKNCHYHKLDLNETKLAFRTDLTTGLNAKVAKIILDESGRNEILTSNSAIVYKMIQNFFGGFMALLWGAIILSKIYKYPLSFSSS